MLSWILRTFLFRTTHALKLLYYIFIVPASNNVAKRVITRTKQHIMKMDALQGVNSKNKIVWQVLFTKTKWNRNTSPDQLRGERYNISVMKEKYSTRRLTMLR